MEERICFSLCSLKLPTAIRWYRRQAIVLAREHVEVHLHAPSNQDLTVLAMWMGELSYWKSESLLRNTTWTTGCTWLPKMSKVTGRNSTIKVIIGTAEYPDTADQIITDPPQCSQEEPGIQDYGLPWAFSKHKPGMMLGTTWRTTHLTILRISNHQTSRFHYYHTKPFSLLALFSVTRGSATVTLPWKLDLWSSCLIVLCKQGLQHEYWVLLSLLLP